MAFRKAGRSLPFLPRQPLKSSALPRSLPLRAKDRASTLDLAASDAGDRRSEVDSVGRTASRGPRFRPIPFVSGRQQERLPCFCGRIWN